MRIATYARVSTREQRDGRTIESQAKALEAEVDRRGAALVERYQDDGVSGSTLDRPGLDRLRNHAARGRFDAVLVYSVDRLSRDAANLAVVTRDLDRRGIKLLFLNVPEASGPEAKMIVGILGQFAEFERLLIRDRARRGRRFKVEERGVVAGTEAPFGYTYIKQDKERGIVGRYEVKPGEAKVVKLVFKWVVEERLSTVKVARRLNELRIPTRRGKAWRHSTVANMLANETYTCTTYYNKSSIREIEVNGTWVRRVRRNPRSEWIAIPLPSNLRLVSDRRFRRAREIVESKRTYPERRKYFYLLRNIKKTCAVCNRALTSVSCHGKRRYYVCGTVRSGGTCQYKTIRAERAEIPLWTLFERLVKTPGFVQTLIKEEKRRRQAAVASSGNSQRNLRRQAKRCTAEQNRLVQAYRRGILGIDAFEREYKTTTSRLRELESQLVDASSPTVGSDEVATDIEEWAGPLRQALGALDDRQREHVVAEVFTSIVFDGNLMRIAGGIPQRRLASKGSREHGSESARSRHSFELSIPMLSEVPSVKAT